MYQKNEGFLAHPSATVSLNQGEYRESNERLGGIRWPIGSRLLPLGHERRGLNVGFRSNDYQTPIPLAREGQGAPREPSGRPHHIHTIFSGPQTQWPLWWPLMFQQIP